ncbi:MAG: DUF790 family protein, partial [Candidatus Hodarchaeales archaeon]
MDISFRRQRKADDVYFVPLLLESSSQSEGIKEIIAEFERVVGLPEDQLDQNHISNIFSDRKITMGLLQTLTRSFYQLRGLKYNPNFVPWELRCLLYKKMEESSLTWATYRQQIDLVTSLVNDGTILNLSSEVGNPEELIKNYLFADHSINFHIIRKVTKAPTVDEVILQYNTDVIRFLFNKTYSINLFLSESDLNGPLIKRIVQKTKFFGIHTDVRPISELNQVLISALGALELVGRSSKYGKNLYSFFISIVSLLQAQKIKELVLEIQYYERRMKVIIPITTFPTLLQFKDGASKIQYDSKVEEKFDKHFSANFP